MRNGVMLTALVGMLMMPPTEPAQAAGHNHFTIMVSSKGTKAEFSYQTSLPSGASWVGGDRVGYRCAYMFLIWQGQVVGRVTFTQIEYAKVNDKFMDEGARWYDGTVYTGSHHQLNDCPRPLEPYADANGPIGPLPVMTFSDAATGQALEVRNYVDVVQGGTGKPWKFQVVTARPQHVTVIGYQDGESILAIYYDRLSPTIRLTSNFQSG